MKPRAPCILLIAALAGLHPAFAADTSDSSTPAFKPVTPVASAEPLAGARKLIAEKKWAAAIQELNKLNDTTNADWHNLLGYSHRKARTPDLAAAERHYDAALRINPQHRGALEYAGELALMQGRLELAEQRLATLDKTCAGKCEELEDLKRAVARYKAGGNKFVAAD